MIQNILVIINNSIYETEDAENGLDFVMAATAFDLPVKILFKNNGVLNLISNVNNNKTNQDENSIDFIKAADLYEIDPIYIIKSDLTKHNLDIDKLILDKNLIELIDDANLDNFLKKFDHIINY